MDSGLRSSGFVEGAQHGNGLLPGQLALFDLGEDLPLFEALGSGGVAEGQGDVIELFAHGGIGDSQFLFHLLDIAAGGEEGLDKVLLLGREQGQAGGGQLPLKGEGAGGAAQFDGF